MISQNRCLILKIILTLWYHKYDFLISHKWFCDIRQNSLYQKIDFMISKNRICDITKSWRFFWYHNFFLYIYIYIYQKSIFYTKKSGLFYDIKNRFGYIKFDFVISQSGGFIVHTGLFQDFINNNGPVSLMWDQQPLTVKNLRPKYIYVFVSFSGFSLESYVRQVRVNFLLHSNILNNVLYIYFFSLFFLYIV